MRQTCETYMYNKNSNRLITLDNLNLQSWGLNTHLNLMHDFKLHWHQFLVLPRSEVSHGKRGGTRLNTTTSRRQDIIAKILLKQTNTFCLVEWWRWISSYYPLYQILRQHREKNHQSNLKILLVTNIGTSTITKHH